MGCGAGGAGEDCAAGRLVPRRETASVSRSGASTIWPPDTAAALSLSRPARAAKTSALQTLQVGERRVAGIDT